MASDAATLVHDDQSHVEDPAPTVTAAFGRRNYARRGVPIATPPRTPRLVEPTSLSSPSGGLLVKREFLPLASLGGPQFPAHCEQPPGSLLTHDGPPRWRPNPVFSSSSESAAADKAERPISQALPELPSHYAAVLALREHAKARQVESVTSPRNAISLEWAACSDAAHLKYGRTTVSRIENVVPQTESWSPPSRPGTCSSSTRPSTGVSSRPTTGNSWKGQKNISKGHFDGNASYGISKSVFDGEVPSPTCSPSWDTLAVGHVSALLPVSGGVAFEVSAEHAAHTVRRFEMRSITRDMRQRPQLYIGVTAISPEDAFFMSPNPYKLGQHCWMMSASSGHIFSDGRTELAALASGAHDGDEPPRPPTSARSTTLRLLVTTCGSLDLSINGVVVARSRPDFLPRTHAKSNDALFPLVVLGPNISQVTLRRAK